MPPKFKRPPPPKASASAGLSPDDEDAFFSRNPKGWDAIKVENIASPTKSSRDSSDSEDIPAPKRRKGKAVKKESDWTKPGAVIVLDSGSEPEIVADGSRKKSSPGKGKGKAKVTRERSITPPPEVPEDAMMDAKRIIKEVFFGGEADDAAKLSQEDEEMEDEEEDPEVSALLAGARRAEEAAFKSRVYDVQSPTYDDPASPALSQEEEEDKLKLKVQWKGPALEEGKGKWAFAFNHRAPFRRLNETMQTKTKLPEKEIVLAHNGHRILLGATPKSLRMRKDTTETIEVYPKWQWDAEEHETSSTPLTSPKVDDMAPATIATQAGGTQAEEEEDDGGAVASVLVLSIRSGAHPNAITISAKRTAKVSSVLTKYLQKVGENPAALDVLGGAGRGKKTVKLSFDGEELAAGASVGSVDAEDEDMWDVVGL